MAKNIKIKTLEGLEVKNLSRGWSMEWGEGGSMHCDLYFNGKKFCEVTQEGNGGCADERYVSGLTTEEKDSFKEAVLKFLKRVDPIYGENSPYDWLKNRTAAGINGDDLEAVENSLEDRENAVKKAKKAFKDNWRSFGVITETGGFTITTFGCNFDTLEQVKNYLKDKKPDLKYENIELIRFNDDLTVY